MISEIKKQPLHYLILVVILILGIAAILVFRFNPQLKNMAIYILAGLYVVWGIVHHYLTDYLRLKVVLEYLLFAVLAVLIINTLL